MSMMMQTLFGESGGTPAQMQALQQLQQMQQMQTLQQFQQMQQMQKFQAKAFAGTPAKPFKRPDLQLPFGLGQPPTKKFAAGKGKKPIVRDSMAQHSAADTLIAEVRFDDPSDAAGAVVSLGGSNLGGNPIRVELCQQSQDSSKVIVTNVPRGMEWQELKDHFGVCGTVAFVKIKGGSGLSVGTIRYATLAEATQAVVMFNGAELSGSQLEVKPHPGSTDKTKLQVFGIAPGLEWQELKDFFGTAGTVIFSEVIHSGMGGNVGEVRYDDASHAAQAMTMLQGSQLGGATIVIMTDLTSQDGTKLIVKNIPGGIEWQELKDHFSPIGTVAFCDIKKTAGKGMHKGKGKGNGGGGMMGNGNQMQMLQQQMMMGNMNPMMMQQMMMQNAMGGSNMGKGGGNKKFGGGKWVGLLASSPGGAKVGGGSKRGEVRFTDPVHCMLAISMLNGTSLNGAKITVDYDPLSQDQSKLVVTGIPSGVGWQDLKVHFSGIGEVAFADVKPAFIGR